MADRFVPALLFASAAGARAADLFVALTQARAAVEPATRLVDVLGLLNGALAVLVCAIAAVLLLGRRPRRGARAGPPAVCVALLGTLAMNGVLLQPAASGDPWLLALGGGLVAAGLGFTVYAAASLGPCFGVAPEARGLVTTGAYRLVRHPLYLGEAVAALGIVLAAASPWTLVVFALFCVCQAARAALEERALAAAFPGYAWYCRQTPALLPARLPQGKRSRPHWPPESA